MDAPTFFASAAEFRDWLERHADSAAELSVGFSKVGGGRPGITWPEAVDEALCVGWIDGVRHRVDDDSYRIRFTPRKPGSTWSAVNIERVRVLSEAGRLQPAGQRAFACRQEKRSRVYAYEQPVAAVLTAAEERVFRDHPGAWSFFEQQPPGYRKKVLWWIVGARRPDTRARRLTTLVESCQSGRRL